MVKGRLKMKEQKFLPEGYYYLNIGEPIKQDDYFWNQNESKWKKIVDTADTSNWVEAQVIRKK